MDLFSIQCFIAVAEAKSFTKAAENVGRTQSAITQQISNLEKKLNTQLFERGKKITLTSEGEIFLGYALKMYKLEREVLDHFKEPSMHGEVIFGVPEDFATVFLTDVLVDFARSHPKVGLNVECDLTFHLFEKFRDEKLDLVLVKMSSCHDFPYGVEIWSEPLVWVQKTNSKQIIESNEAIPLVLSPNPCVYRLAALDALQNIQRKSKVVFTSPSYAGMIAAVKADLGLTVLPSTLIPEGLEILKNEDLPDLPDLHVSLLSRENMTAPIASLKEHLLKKLKVQRH